jgi:hypothetical protein
MQICSIYLLDLSAAELSISYVLDLHQTPED